MKNISQYKIAFIAFLIGSLFLFSCEPLVEDGIDLPDPPSASFSWNFLPGDSNRVVFESNSNDGFIHFWDFGNGLTSNERGDTIFYPQAGAYEVTYSVSNSGGMGTANALIDIAVTVELPCEGMIELLTGCDDQKTWIFSQAAGAISVGPAPYSTEWFTSPAGGLVDEQYDDSYQFTFEGDYIYTSNNSTINPFEGYISTDLPIPDDLTYFITEGTGTSGEDQIHLQSCWFMGVWDSGPLYDIIELTETTLVIHGAVQNGDCSVGEGFFTLSFVAQ